MTSLTVTIPGRPPNPNDFGHGKSHWALRNRETRKWRGDACLIARTAKPAGWVALGRAVIRVTFIVPDHGRRDIDNLIASIKPLTDGLVDAGLLVDDSLEVIRDIRFDWSYQRGVAATVYHIEGDADTVPLGL